MKKLFTIVLSLTIAMSVASPAFANNGNGNGHGNSNRPSNYEDNGADLSTSSFVNSNSQIYLASPSGGQVYQRGDTINYQAKVFAPNGGTVSFYLTKNKSWRSGKPFLTKSQLLLVKTSVKADQNGQAVSGSAIVNENIKKGKYYAVAVLQSGNKNSISSASARIEITNKIRDPKPDSRGQVTLINPNGGTAMQIGSKQDVSWKKSDGVKAVDLFLQTYDGSKKFGVAYSLTDSNYVWEAGKFTDVRVTNEGKLAWNSTVAPGAYFMQVCVAGTSNCDSSDSYFKLYSDSTVPPTTRPSLHVETPNGGEAYKIGTTIPFSFSYSNIQYPDSFTVYLYSPTLGNIPGYEYHYKAPGDGKTGGEINIGKDVTAGEYKITVCTTNTVNPDVKFKQLCDSSDSVFKIVSSVPTYTAGDINYDGVVNVDDLLVVIGSWGKCPAYVDPTVNLSNSLVADDLSTGASTNTLSRIKNPCPADLNSDGKVDNIDLQIVIRNWTR